MRKLRQNAAISTKHEYALIMIVLTIIGLLIMIYGRDDNKKDNRPQLPNCGGDYPSI